MPAVAGDSDSAVPQGVAGLAVRVRGAIDGAIA
jgi:hypothetical protein